MFCSCGPTQPRSFCSPFFWGVLGNGGSFSQVIMCSSVWGQPDLLISIPIGSWAQIARFDRWIVRATLPRTFLFLAAGRCLSDRLWLSTTPLVLPSSVYAWAVFRGLLGGGLEDGTLQWRCEMLLCLLGESIWGAVRLKDRVVYACFSQVVEPLESHAEKFPSFSR